MPSAKRVGRPERQETLARRQEQAIGRLAGQPIGPAPAAPPESASGRIALLMERIRELQEPPVNPYQRDFTRFRTELCWTRDEARGGRERLMPDHPYLREVDEQLLTKTPLFIEKSRRTIISWAVCCFDLWIAGGGQDARWPQLLESTRNRGVIIASQKMTGVAGSKEMLRRVRFIADQFEERGLREQWPAFPEFGFTAERAVGTNGSFLYAVAQGPNQLRGPGITLIHADEVSYWPEARASLASALQTLQGGGHLAAIGTANAASFAASIVAGKVRLLGKG